jgi:uncharacterized cofD-like protein
MARIVSIFKWLYPGMRVKRWLGTMSLGIALVSVGIYLALGLHIAGTVRVANRWLLDHSGVDLSRATIPIGILMVVGGLLVVLYAIQRIVRSVADVVAPYRSEGISEIVYRKRALSHGQRIVVIGGGTGLSTMLRGLKRYTSNLTAIVTVTDDGGSSGRLVREYNVLPPGDIRNCLVALADNEGLMAKLFQYRFTGADEGLGGHSFGNLLLLAMGSVTGSFDEAIRETSRVLAVRGRVLPSTLDRVILRATMSDGAVIYGETAIADAGWGNPIHRVSLAPDDVAPLPEALDAIAHADAVILGPGSVYTSVIPDLLVPGIADALRRTAATRIYICNVMTQPGETDGFSAADHVRAIEDHAGKDVVQTVLVNTAMPSEEAQRRYAARNSHFVRPDIECLTKIGYRALAADFLNETNLVRHDPQKLADAIMEIVG